MFPHGEFVYKRDSDNFVQLHEEHKRIFNLLDDLAATCVHLDDELSCADCSRAQHGVCHGRLPSFLHDLIDLCAVHFYREECLIEQELIDSSIHAALKTHHKAHIVLLRRISQLSMSVSALHRQHMTDQAYRDFSHEISALLEEHDQQFDNALTELMHQIGHSKVI